MATSVSQMVAIFVVQPFLVPDPKAASLGFIAFSVMTFISSLLTPLSEFEIGDFVVPVLTAMYIYLHNYNRSDTISGQSQRQASSSHGAISWIDLKNLLTDSISTGHDAESFEASLNFGDLVCVFVLDRESRKKLSAFQSIAVRHGHRSDCGNNASRTRKTKFLVVSGEGASSYAHLSKDFGTCIDELGFLANAGNFIEVIQDQSQSSDSPMVVAMRLEEEGQPPRSMKRTPMAQVVWRGHVAVLEHFLNANITGDSDSSGDSE